eukprot:393528-Pleurochrysis_carterae.AAC.1
MLTDEGDILPFVQYCALFPSSYTNAARQSTDCTTMISCAIVYASSSSQSVANMPPPAQAQLLCNFFRRTSVPRKLDFFPAADICLAELDRRSSAMQRHNTLTCFVGLGQPHTYPSPL